MIKTLKNVTTQDIKDKIKPLCDAAGLSLRDASIKIGANETYLQQFISRPSPIRLNEKYRTELASLLNVPEQDLTDYDLGTAKTEAYDQETLADILEYIENLENKYKRRLKPTDKIQLLFLIYEEVCEIPEPEQRQAKIIDITSMAYRLKSA